MANEFARNIQDATLTGTKAFPAAGANNSFTAFDLGDAVTKHALFEGEISWPALAALADAKSVTFKVQDSADNSTFADLGIQKIITGAGGAGVAAGTYRFRIPSGCNRYLRVNQAEEASGGDITASSATLKLLF